MLNPKKKTDHQVYSDILTPPVDYPILQKAVSTTYSLNISALVSCMIPLAFSDDVNSHLFQNKVSTLTALRNLSSKLIVFCDPGQIKPLKNKNKEFAILLEKMIAPVLLEPVDTILPSFHPKLWLLQFSNSKHEHSYRLIILSRNISYDHSYDISLVLESNNEKRGKGETERGYKKTLAISKYLNYLKEISKISDEQKHFIDELLSTMDQEKVCFKIDNPYFDSDDWSIYPIYRDTFRKDKKLFEKLILSNKDGYKKILVMSPFISEDILSKLQNSLIPRNTTEKKIKLITRQSSLSTLDTSKLPEFAFYVLNANIIEGADYSFDDKPETDQELPKDSDIRTEEILNDIHAKIILTESKDRYDLFIGSANVTNSAFNRNNELVIRLKSNSNIWSVDNFFKELNTDKENMFVPAEIVETNLSELTVQKEVEYSIRELTHIPVYGNVDSIEDTYSIDIYFDRVPSPGNGVKITICPLSLKTPKEINSHILFENIELCNISEFYTIIAEKKDRDNLIRIERLLKIPTKGIPYKERDSLLINQVIKDKASFIEYVTLLLSQDSISTQLELSELNQTSTKWKIINTQMPLYETLLKASVINPQAVLNLSTDLELISNKNIVSEDFLQLYEEFKKAIEK